jgi:hypothetical protein
MRKSLHSVIVHPIFGGVISGYAWLKATRPREGQHPKIVRTQHRMGSSEEIAGSVTVSCVYSDFNSDRLYFKYLGARARVIVCDCCLGRHCDQLPPRLNSL